MIQYPWIELTGTYVSLFIFSLLVNCVCDSLLWTRIVVYSTENRLQLTETQVDFIVANTFQQIIVFTWIYYIYSLFFSIRSFTGLWNHFVFEIQWLLHNVHTCTYTHTLSSPIQRLFELRNQLWLEIIQNRVAYIQWWCANVCVCLVFFNIYHISVRIGSEYQSIHMLKKFD